MNELDIFKRDTQEFLIKSGRPVLLIGEKGVGKTSVLRSMSTNFNMKMHELNAATLDPFVHIVGIPVTVDNKIQMNPPDELMDAEILFIDEINRADRPTRNSLFEIVCDNSVNGRKLPNLKLVVAAMNPPDSVYQVDELDDAMDDRFLYRFNVQRDISYAKKFVSESDAELMQKWYSAIENPPSPRRLTWAIDNCFKDGKIANAAAFMNALPDAKYNTSSLLKMLDTGSAGMTNDFVSDKLFSKEENTTAAWMMFSAIIHARGAFNAGDQRRDTIKGIAYTFMENDGKTWLFNPGATPMASLDMMSTFESSDELKKLDEMIPFTAPMLNDNHAQHLTLHGVFWLNELVRDL